MDAILHIAVGATVKVTNNLRVFVGTMNLMPGSVVDVATGSTVRVSRSTTNVFNGASTITGGGTFALGLDAGLGIGAGSTLSVDCVGGLVARADRAIISGVAGANSKLAVNKFVVENGSCKILFDIYVVFFFFLIFF